MIIYMCRYTPVIYRYLWFAIRNQVEELLVYQWKVLSFGLATAPRVFTKLLAHLEAHMHLKGCLMYLYINGLVGPIPGLCSFVR